MSTRLTIGGIIANAVLRSPVRAAWVHPVSAHVIGSIVQATQIGLVRPVLVGPRERILLAADQAGVSISDFEIINTVHSHEAAELACRLAADGEVDVLVKGSLSTDELMSVVLSRQSRLRTERRLSHVWAMEVATYPKLLLITDAAINVMPTLMQKRDIVQNSIDLAHAIGIDSPMVAVLSAMEFVKPEVPSTLDAAALCKMADRGQIQGAVLDGPLAFDTAISASSAAEKGLISPIAGKADIFVVPDIEAGNIMAKQLSYLGNACSAGMVMGARVPIVLTSRSETEKGRVASVAIAALYHHFRREKEPCKAISLP